MNFNFQFHVRDATEIAAVSLGGKPADADLRWHPETQNELTNAHTKFMALETALVAGNATALNAVIRDLARTERNFVLKKGETTVEMERLKHDSDPVKDVIEQVVNARNDTKKNKA
jgi:hypothetical protein